MRKSFFSTKLFRVAAVLAVCIALVMLRPSRITDPIRSVFLYISSPFQKVFYAASVSTRGVGEFISSIGSLKNENESLIVENQKLKAQNAQLGDVQHENDMLRQQFDLLPRDTYDLEAADVIGQDPQGTQNWIDIDKGQSSGLQIGMPVIVSKGILVGIIEEVSANRAHVTLLTNPQNAINVMSSQTGAKGILRGEFGLGMIFDMILQTDTVNTGDDVITSGIGQDMPKGLYVGTVQEVHPTSDRLFQQAVVISPVHVSKLNFVFAVKQRISK